MSFLIFFTGFTAVGKSTISRYLSSNLNTEILHSAELRNELNLSPKKEESGQIFDFRSDKRKLMDDLVYNKIIARAEEFLKNNKNIIIDAGNFFMSKRVNYYKLCKKYSAELFIIKVICSDESLIKSRLNKRLKHYHNSKFNEAASINIYNSTKLVMEDPLDDFDSKEDLPNIIQYDTATNELEIVNEKSNIIKPIIHTLKKFSFSN